MPKFTKEQVCEAVDRAHKWAHANPTKITRGSLAVDANGKDVGTMNQSASCYCALGRLAHELRINIRSGMRPLFTPLDLLGLSVDDVWKANDRYMLRGGTPVDGFDLMKEACDAQNA